MIEVRLDIFQMESKRYIILLELVQLISESEVFENPWTLVRVFVPLMCKLCANDFFLLLIGVIGDLNVGVIYVLEILLSILSWIYIFNGIIQVQLLLLH